MKQACVVLSVLLVFAALSSSVVAQQCGVEVASGDVANNRVNFTIRNTGLAAEVISYSLSVSSSVIYNGTSTIQKGETASFMVEHNFTPNNFASYEVKIKAHADCGSNHSLTVVHWIFDQYTCSNPQGTETQNICDYSNAQYITCTNGQWAAESQDQYCGKCPHHCGDGICSCAESYSSCPADCPSSCTQGYIDSYSCDGNILQRAYRYVNCTRTWIVQNLCLNGCYNGSCINQTTPRCGVQIMSFDYVSQVLSGLNTYITMTSKNTGESQTRINNSLWVDDILRDYKYQDVASGSTLQSTLNYPAGTGGQHSILVKSRAGCGSEDSRVSSITTISSSQPPIGPGPLPPAPTVPKATTASFYPSSIDTTVYSSKIVGIGMVTSKPQSFAISASGLPDGWVQYSNAVSVDDEKTAYIYITPRSLGNYTLHVSARPALENLTFTADIPVFVVELGTPISETFLGEAWDNFMESMKYLTEHPLLLAGAFALILVIVLLIGHRHLKREKWPLVG